jgi:hypothetical protein
MTKHSNETRAVVAATALTPGAPPTLPQSTSSRRRTIWASTALATLLSLTACSSSSSPSSKATAGGSAAAADRSTATASSPVSNPSSALSGAVSTHPSAHAGGGYCSLLTADEARAVVGDGLAPGVSRTAPTPKIGGHTGSCVYKLVHPTTAATVVNLIVLGTKIPRSLFDTEITQSADKSRPVPGLGEEAFGSAGLVTVYDHGLVLALEILKGGKPVAAATLVAMLRTALSRAGGLR